jgi:hypothetical protein
VAADIAVKLCDSVAAKLEGKVLGTFSSKFVILLRKLNFESANFLVLHIKLYLIPNRSNFKRIH